MGEQLYRLYEEFAKRDITDITSEKLFELTMKTLAN